MANPKKSLMMNFLLMFFVGDRAITRMLSEVISKKDISALEWATENTFADILDEKVKFNISSHTESTNNLRFPEYGERLDEVAPPSISEEHIGDEQNSSLHKLLFESIGEVPYTDIPEIKSALDHEYSDVTDKTHPNTNGQVLNVVPPSVSEPKGSAPLDKDRMNKYVFIIPAIILLIGAIAYFFVIPNNYGSAISFVDWLFTDPQNIIDTLCAPNAVLPHANSIIGIRIFWWIWLATLSASLFFVGKQLQAKSEPNAANAILTKKEPYLMVQNVSDILKQVKARRNSKQLDSLIYSIKKLEERLSVESDFGYGKSSVINCENIIAKQMQFLLGTAPYIENGNFDENLKAMNVAVANINSLLRRRVELKKR